jgi:ornithine--oxo-acid transaminase
VLFVADEVQAGLGRTGHLLATRTAGVDADVYLLGKALGGGILPLSAVVADADVLGVLRPGQHGSTFGGNPLACAVGRAVIRLLDEGDLLAGARHLGAHLHERLARLVGHGVLRVRGVGLWAGVDIDPRLGTGRAVSEALAARGVLVKDTHGSTVRLSPPLVVTEAELDTAVDALADTLASLRRA